MIKKLVSLALALTTIAIPSDGAKKATVSRNFSVSAPKFRMSEDGTIEQVPTFTPMKKSSAVPFSGDFPEKFDLRDYGKMTPVKDQGDLGTCWAHAACACAESSVIESKPDIDLSELHVAYYSYSGNGQIEPPSDDIYQNLKHGGNYSVVTSLWSQWLGPVFEKNLPYGNLDFFNNSEKTEEMKYNNEYLLENSYSFDYDKDRTNVEDINWVAKYFLQNGCPIDVSFCSNSEYYNEEYSTTNSNEKPRKANHAVVIAGWDDNFPAEKFNIKPEHDGAWLVKNSWGDDFGDGGYMWISYEDTSLCEFTVFELEGIENHDWNFYNDTFPCTQWLCAFDDMTEIKPSYMSNIFYNDVGKLQMEEISTYIGTPGTEYEITVYTGLSDVSDPTSGTPSEVTKGYAPVTGYVTLPLDNYVMLGNDEYFSVVVKLYNEYNGYVIPLETALYVTDEKGEITDLSSYTTLDGLKEYTGKNESFYSDDGKRWQDITDDEDYIYSDEEVEMLIEQLEEDFEDSPEALEIYKDLLHSGEVAMMCGNISLKAICSNVGVVDFSHEAGVVPDGTLIEITARNGEDVYYSINDMNFIPYTGPIEIDSSMTINATWGDYFSSRMYVPESKFVGVGDVDGSGKIDAQDASAVLMRYSALSVGEPTWWGFMVDYADYNRDGQTDALDASLILQKYAELSTK